MAIKPVATSITAFIGRARRGPMNAPVSIPSAGEFTRRFGEADQRFPMSLAVRDFFAHGGKRAIVVRARADRSAALAALARVDLFNLLCILPDRVGASLPPQLWRDALRVCVDRRAMLLIDAPADPLAFIDTLAFDPKDARNAALYFPEAPMGAIAGVIARTDETRGVWKAPAGVEAVVNATVPPLRAEEIQRLALAGVNPLRRLPDGKTVIWGARTLAPNDNEWRFIPLRRFNLFLEESIDRDTEWEVHEVETFMTDLWRTGALVGSKPEEAFVVRLRGLELELAYAPVRPREFTWIRLSR